MITWLLACVPPPVDAETASVLAEMALPEQLPPPTRLTVVDEDAAIALGRRLYVAPLGCEVGDPGCAGPTCQSCHALCLEGDDQLCDDPLEGGPSGADDEALTTQAVGLTSRNVPTVVNTVFRPRWGWAGRFCTMADQIAFPLLKPDVMVSVADAAPELAGPLRAASWGDATYQEFWAAARARVAAQVRLGHGPAYARAFGDAPDGPDEVVFDRAMDALEAFVRTLVARDTPLDAFLAGDDGALEPAALRGAERFVGKGHCAACHRGPLLSDGEFHNVGVPDDDLGRAKADGPYCDRTDPPDAALAGQFQTAALRHVGATGPWMHDGSFTSLWEVVEHYDLGGEPSTLVGAQDARIRPLGLDAGERADLEAFLRALGPR